jgi:spermidine synthase
METVQTLARHEGPHGDVVLRRRTEGAEAVEELIINGVFAMDSSDTGSERRLADLAMAGVPVGGRILVGGLGLGYTVAALLGHGTVHVVEIEACLIDWAHAGLTPTLQALAADPGVRLHCADVRQVLTGLSPPHGPWNAILLDVDNGPDFLIHAANDALYAEPALRAAYAHLAEGGICAIWCQGPSPQLLERLQSISPEVTTHVLPRQSHDRMPPDVIYTMVKPDRAR